MSGIRSRCAALNCQSTTSLTHRFPKDYERCRIWAERAGCLHLLEKGVEVLNTSYRLCSDHFHDRCYTSTERKRLSNFALPEIFFHNSDNSEAENLDYQPLSYFKSEEPTEINLDLLCRICACKSEELVPVFGEQGLELQLLDKIHTHLPIMVTGDELLPVTVCTDCIYKLEICHELVHSCLEGDARLRTILGLDTNNEVYTGEHDEAQFSPLQSPPEVEHDSDNEEDTDMFKDSSGEQDDSNHMEDTHMLRVPKDEFHNVDSYAHDEYVLEDSSDSQLDDGDQDSTDQMQEMESASAPPEDSRDIRSQSLGKKEPKFKVVVVKIKNVSNLAPDAQIEKALDHLKNVQATSEPAATKKQHSVREETFEQPQEQENSGLESPNIELPDYLTVSLLNQSSIMSLPILSNEDTKAIDIKPGRQILSDVYDKTISTVFAENKVSEEGISLDVLRKASVDHSYTRWDQTVYCCTYCKKTVVGKDSLTSHQTTSHPDKVFCCPVCDIIIYESKQVFDEHTKTHLRKSECDEDTVKINWYSAEDSSGLEGDLKSGMALPLLKISELDLGSLHKKTPNQIDKQSEVEIVRVADIRIVPERSILKKGLFQSNSKFRVKISKDFENIDSNLKTKIIGTIMEMIKESNNEGTKVIKTERSSEETDEMQKPSKTEEILPQNKPERKEIKYKRWKCKQCDHLSVSWEEHLEHIRVHPPMSYPCSKCDKQFSSKTRLQFHTSTHTLEKAFICEYCGKGFRNRQSLKNHLYTHDEGEKMFECQDCGKKFGTKGGYESHCASHTEASYLCDLCGKSIKHVSSLRLHRLTHIDPSFFRRHYCVVCGKTCRNRYLLTEHMRVHTNERPFKCVHCGKTFHKRSQLSQHTLIHADARQHKCPVCERGFNRVGNMKVHLKTHQQSSKYTCKICKEAFENLGELIGHRKTHCKEEVGEAMKQNESQCSEPLMYVCDVCGKLLATKLTLKYHMMIHEEDRPFSCETCGKKFALKTKLQLHQKIHSSEKPYRCRFCNEGFQTKQYQVVHERIHTGEKPYECTQCDKAFRSRISLNQHALVHSDVRPFRCHHCDKGFRRRDTLDTHLRTHTGERPYSCQICDRRFKQKGDCNKHQKTHSKGRKAAAQIQDPSVPVIFCCMICGLNFNQKEELEGHFKAFHTPDLMVSSSTMIINTDDFVALPEIVQNEKTIILPSFGPGCDSN